MLTLAWRTEAGAAWRSWRVHHPHPLVPRQRDGGLWRRQGGPNEPMPPLCGLSQATLSRALHASQEGGVAHRTAWHVHRQASARVHQRTTWEAHVRAPPPRWQHGPGSHAARPQRGSAASSEAGSHARWDRGRPQPSRTPRKRAKQSHASRAWRQPKPVRGWSACWRPRLALLHQVWPWSGVARGCGAKRRAAAHAGRCWRPGLPQPKRL